MSIYNVLLNYKMNNDHINSIILIKHIKKHVRWRKKKITFKNIFFAYKIKLDIVRMVMHEMNI